MLHKAVMILLEADMLNIDMAGYEWVGAGVDKVMALVAKVTHEHTPSEGHIIFTPREYPAGQLHICLVPAYGCSEWTLLLEVGEWKREE